MSAAKSLEELDYPVEEVLRLANYLEASVRISAEHLCNRLFFQQGLHLSLAEILILWIEHDCAIKECVRPLLTLALLDSNILCVGGSLY